MTEITSIFNQGPGAVKEFCTSEERQRTLDDLELKQLADICWTRANTRARAKEPDAKSWAEAALAGYEVLGRFGKPPLAQSARENVKALRSWSLLNN